MNRLNPTPSARGPARPLPRTTPSGAHVGEAATGDPTVATARKIVAELFGPPVERSFAARYWDGTTELPADRAPSCTFVLHGPQALRRLLLPPSELAFAGAYVGNELDILGDMEAAVAVAFGAAQRFGSPRTLGRLIRLALELPSGSRLTATNGTAQSNLQFGHEHTRGSDAAAIRHHYDVGNDFYRLWLDERLVYSCAYFETEADDIDTAQANKLEHICRKLRLRPGERLLDIGCGWGALIMYAAEHHGVEATGITVSAEQAAMAQERIAAAGLSRRCRVEVCDYRDIPKTEPFDKIASVGMIEHVGHRQFPAYFGHAYDCLRPGGLFFNQGIVRALADPAAPQRWLARNLWRNAGFVYRYVFPNGELVPLAQMIDAAERSGFETRDCESLRQHYALTTRRWAQRLEANHEQAAALVGEAKYRVWRLYLAAAAYGFEIGSIGLAQMLFSKPGPAGQAALPLTRADLYAPPTNEDGRQSSVTE